MSRATWTDVEAEIRRLAETRETFTTALSPENRICEYDPLRRLTLQNGRGSSFVDIDDIRACWKTFEERGAIRRQDVLEPGRCSAFVMALFARIPGVGIEERRNEPWLVLPAQTTRR